MVVVVVAMVVVPTPARRVGTGFGVERGLDIVGVSAQTLNHFRDHVVGANPDAIAEELDREMAVAQMPGNADEFAFVMGMDFEQGFRFGGYPDDTASSRKAVTIA